MNNSTIRQVPIMNNRNNIQNKQQERTHINIRSAQSQKIPKPILIKNHSDINDNNNNHTWTWYRRLIKKPDRLLYN